MQPSLDLCAGYPSQSKWPAVTQDQFIWLQFSFIPFHCNFVLLRCHRIYWRWQVLRTLPPPLFHSRGIAYGMLTPINQRQDSDTTQSNLMVVVIKPYFVCWCVRLNHRSSCSSLPSTIDQQLMRTFNLLFQPLYSLALKINNFHAIKTADCFLAWNSTLTL